MRKPTAKWMSVAFCVAALTVCEAAAPSSPAQRGGSDRLRGILRAPVPDNPRTRRYQARLDELAETALKRLKARPRRYSNRNTTEPLGVLGFCYYSPLSRHHRSADILAVFSDALEKWADGISESSETPPTLPSLGWSHGWDIEGLIMGYVWLEDDLTPALKEKAMAAFAATGARFVAKIGEHGDIGGIGNQLCVRCVGEVLYGLILDRPDYVAAAASHWAEIADRVLQPDGQVFEQYGPCMHYSYTAFVYAFQYLYLSGDRSYDARLAANLDWFRWWHTESLYQFPGASSRGYNSVRGTWSDLYGALEYSAERMPMFQRLMDRMIEKDPGGIGHVCSTLIWAILNCPKGELPAPSDDRKQEWNATGERYFQWVYFGRSPIKYCLVRHKYQTSITFEGYLPLKGLQTWAWGDEPPIIHPTLSVRSATRAWGIDSAEFSCSHEYPGEGPGAMAEQIYWSGKNLQRRSPAAFVVWRLGSLRCVALFTPSSTVIVYSGPTGKRITSWALNPWEPATPSVGEGVVTFAGRTGRLLSLPGRAAPTIAVERDEQTGKNVTLLQYECGGEPTVFAFSDASFTFLSENLAGKGVFEFSDSSGGYRVDISGIVDGRGYLRWDDSIVNVERIAGDGKR